MTIRLSETRLVDSTKRALLKYDFLGDGTQLSNTTLIDVSTLAFAKNANSYVMTANADPLSTYRNAVRGLHVMGNINGSLQLTWANTGPLAYMSRYDNFNLDAVSEAGSISNPNPNSSNGDIWITTNGSTANDAWTLIVDLRKDNRDYSAGAQQDPYAFNNSRDGSYVR